ncbi:MAG: TIGR03032 family protein [Bdellovibrionales bacterium]|nr:TIGR03032 family protein [Bdellovibrionales bacterium]
MKQDVDKQDELKKQAPAIGYVHTQNLPGLLHELGISLFVTTYQAQRVMTFGSSDGSRMSMWMRIFARPTGLALRPGEMALGSKNQIWFFQAASDIRDPEGVPLPYELVFVPRHSHVTGDVAIHQMDWVGDRLHFVNSRFSCICTLDPRWSFVPVWKPPFISEISPDDRCHLNGFCTKDGKLRFVTALGHSDAPHGWREKKRDGGILLDVESGESIATGLSMPHTPKWYREKLWVLESGTGSLLQVDPKDGTRTVVQRFPGFLRGLSFYDRLAFVGLCKIREKAEFGGLPVESMYPELKCAVYVIDIETAEILGFIEFTKGIEELFDIDLLPGIRNPHIIGFEEDTVDGIMILPPKEVYS